MSNRERSVANRRSSNSYGLSQQYLKEGIVDDSNVVVFAEDGGGKKAFRYNLTEKLLLYSHKPQQ